MNEETVPEAMSPSGVSWHSVQGWRQTLAARCGGPWLFTTWPSSHPSCPDCFPLFTLSCVHASVTTESDWNITRRRSPALLPFFCSQLPFCGEGGEQGTQPSRVFIRYFVLEWLLPFLCCVWGATSAQQWPGRERSVFYTSGSQRGLRSPLEKESGGITPREAGGGDGRLHPLWR